MAIHHDKSAYGKLEKLNKDFSDKEMEDLVSLLNEDEDDTKEESSLKKEKKNDGK